MKMEDFLPARRFVVRVYVHALGAHRIPDSRREPADRTHEGGESRVISIEDITDQLFRYDERVSGCVRRDVQKGESLLVFIDLGRGYFTADNLREYGVFSGHI